MDERRRVTEELQQRMRQLDGETERLLRRLGEYLADQPEEAFSASDMADIHKRVRELRQRLPESQRQVKKIVQLAARGEELERSLRAARARMSELEQESESICEEIGRAAFEAYRAARPEEEEYEEIFGPLLRQEREIGNLESELERTESATRNGNFFRIFRETGRSLYVKGLLSLRKKNVSRGYREAGLRFCESELVKEVDDPELRKTLAPYRDNREAVEKLREESEQLQGRHEEVSEELKALGAERSPQRRMREIEHQIERIEEELVAAAVALGRMYRAKPLSRYSSDAEVQKYLRQVGRAEKSAERCRKQIARIEAANQMDALEKQRVTAEAKVERLEREIRARQQEIRGLKERITEVQQQQQELAKVRGPENTLLRVPEWEESEEEQ